MLNPLEHPLVLHPLEYPLVLHPLVLHPWPPPWPSPFLALASSGLWSGQPQVMNPLVQPLVLHPLEHLLELHPMEHPLGLRLPPPRASHQLTSSAWRTSWLTCSSRAMSPPPAARSH